jgi:endonuclease YncB( thermonuclease family)
MLALLLAIAAPTVVPSGKVFTCTPTRVWDGDGPVWCAEGPRLRLAGIAAREMDGSCRPNQPCPRASAVQARDALVRLLGTSSGTSREGHVLIRGAALTCRSLGRGSGQRTAAWCASPARGDLSCAMLRTGAVLRWQRYWGKHRCSSALSSRTFRVSRQARTSAASALMMAAMPNRACGSSGNIRDSVSRPHPIVHILFV